MRESVQSNPFAALTSGTSGLDPLNPIASAGKTTQARSGVDFAASLLSATPDAEADALMAESALLPDSDTDLSTSADEKPELTVEYFPKAHNDRGFAHREFTNNLVAADKFTGQQATASDAATVTETSQNQQIRRRRQALTNDLAVPGKSKRAETIPKPDPAAAKLASRAQVVATQPVAPQLGSTRPAVSDQPITATGTNDHQSVSQQSALADNAEPVIGTTVSSDRAVAKPSTTDPEKAAAPGRDPVAAHTSRAVKAEAPAVNHEPDQTSRSASRPDAVVAPTNNTEPTLSAKTATPGKPIAPVTTPDPAQATSSRANAAEVITDSQRISVQTNPVTHPGATTNTSPVNARAIVSGPTTGPKSSSRPTVNPTAPVKTAVAPDPVTMNTAEPAAAEPLPAKSNRRADLSAGLRRSSTARSADPKTEITAANSVTSRKSEAIKVVASSIDSIQQPAVSPSVHPEHVTGMSKEMEIQNGALDTAPELPSIDQPLDPENVSEAFQGALGERLISAVRQDLNRAEIRITPEELGPITIELAVDGDSASVVFSADQSGTRSALQDSLQSLRELLDNEGISLTEASVSEQSSSQTGSDERESGQDERQASSTQVTGDPDSDSDQSRPYQAPVRQQGLVDLFA